jgi:F-box/leucine-rich repeat protein 10/11
VSQPSPMELAPQQTRQTHEPSSPFAVKAQIPTHQTQHTPDVPEATPASEPVVRPSDIPSAASASQTHTPPEEAVGAVVQTLVQEAVPAEGSKSKKQQGWPKGKARGPRSTPSTTKRKRSTPKPKGTSAASTSTSADQMQSPHSLSRKLPVAMDVDGASSGRPAAEPQYTSSQNRRHSFSSTFPQLPSSGASSTPYRAQSVPLGGTQFVATPALDFARPAKKPIVEQPDLICAACKSSDSEIKVGDGEQWIGCDGCKEWYHYACAGFSSEREVRDVNKFYCGPCRPKFGETTSRSTDAQRRYNSNLVQRFASQSESTRPLTTPVSMKASSRLPTTTPSITTSPLSRMET